MSLREVVVREMLKDNHKVGDDPLNAVLAVMKKLARNYNLGIYTEMEYDDYVDILSGLMYTKWWL